MLTMLLLLQGACGGAAPAEGGEADRSEGEGLLVGRLEGAGGGAAVAAVDRRGQRRHAGSVAEDGAFRIGGLRLGTPYDLVIDYQQARLEGVDLRVPPSDDEDEQPLSQEDCRELRERMLRLNRFEDEVECLAIEGNVQHAAVLVNKLRTRPFFGSKPGEVIWRAEVWRFTRPDDHWVKTGDELFVVLYRERCLRQEYDARAITFDPKLGGLSPTAETPVIDLGTIALPAPRPGVRLAERPVTNHEESVP
jgi:hypothetical protein